MFCDDCGARQEQQTVQDWTVQEQQAGKGKSRSVEGWNPDTVNLDMEKQVQKQSKIGIAALVMGILAIVTLGLLFVFEILGIVFGIIGLRKNDARTSFAKAGLVLSVIATGLACLIVMLVYLLAW